MKWLFTFSVLLSFGLQAQVHPKHVDEMLDQMVKENVISKEEAEKAKIRMRTMNSAQWEQINQEAKKIASRMPASTSEGSNNKIEEVNKIDLDGAQFKQIQEDMKKIVPAFKD